MSAIHCFPPIENAAARVLILGSMPGKESLRAQQYYAHPRNAFWSILGELVGATPTLVYDARAEVLKSAGIALWDVLASCTRDGSLDSAIDAASSEPNDFASFFSAHPGITRVYFNGAMAESSFRKLVLPSLAIRPLHYQRLPSTSPANAAIPYQRKLEAWRAILS